MRYDHLDHENGTFIQPEYEYEYVYMSIFDI